MWCRGYTLHSPTINQHHTTSYTHPPSPLKPSQMHPLFTTPSIKLYPSHSHHHNYTTTTIPFPHHVPPYITLYPPSITRDPHLPTSSTRTPTILTQAASPTTYAKLVCDICETCMSKPHPVQSTHPPSLYPLPTLHHHIFHPPSTPLYPLITNCTLHQHLNSLCKLNMLNS